MDLRDLAAMGAGVFVGHPPRPNQELEPARPSALGSGLSSPQEIAFGHDSDQTSVAADHRQSTDVALQHDPYRL
jgi:hypothetical protein